MLLDKVRTSSKMDTITAVTTTFLSTCSNVNMHADPHPPTLFSASEWNSLRNALGNLGAPYKGQLADPRRAVYRAFLAINLLQVHLGLLV